MRFSIRNSAGISENYTELVIGLASMSGQRMSLPSFKGPGILSTNVAREPLAAKSPSYIQLPKSPTNVEHLDAGFAASWHSTAPRIL